ncbi:MAG: DUF2842 domain-containing protein [Alphaproteobacteria bacterium]|nr:DUF2842 domain-containing protein [Alphaproteobacteria bacterium]
MATISEPDMLPTRRNTVGIFVLVIGLTLYALIMMALGASLLPENALVQLAFYAFAGLAWLWPARALLHWMARGDDRA